MLRKLLVGLLSASMAVSVAAVPAAAQDVPAPTYPGGSFHALDPKRVVDTQHPSSGSARKLTSLTVPLAQLSLPTSDVSAVVVTFKVVAPVGPGAGTLHSTETGADAGFPFTTNAFVGRTSIMPADRDHPITLRSTRAAYYVLDVTGYFTDPAHAAGGGLMHPVAPSRVLTDVTMSPHTSRTVRVNDGPVPDGAVAVIANITGLTPSAAGGLTVFGAGRPTPPSSLNFVKDQSSSMRVIVPVGTGGRLQINSGAATVRVYLDLTGYFVNEAGLDQSGGAYYLTGPAQSAFDSRPRGSMPTTPHRVLSVDGFMPALAHGIAQPVAVIGELTAAPTGTNRAGYLVTYAAGPARPGIVDISYPATSRALAQNLVVTALNADGEIGLDNPADNAAEVLDVTGAFVRAAPSTLPAGLYGWNAETGQFPASTVLRPSDVEQIAGNLSSSTVLHQDGSVEIWDNNPFDTPERSINARYPVSGLDFVNAVARTINTSFALRGGAVYSWGDNHNDQLGTGSTAATVATPTRVTGLPSITALGVGAQDGYAIDSDGGLWGWGYNGQGELADGSTTDRSTPVRISLPEPVVSVGGTYTYQYAVTASGALYRWGSGTVPAPIAQPCAVGQVVTSLQSYVTLCTDGRVVVNFGHTTTTTGGFVAAAPSTSGTAFQLLRNDGTVWSTRLPADIVQIPDLRNINVIGYAGPWNAAVVDTD